MSLETIVVFFKTLNPEILAILISSVSFVLCILFIVLKYINNISKYLWIKTCNLLFFLHMYLFKYNIYFKTMEKIYKMHFFFFSVISGTASQASNKKNFPKSIKIMRFLYFNPYIYPIMVILFVVCELLFTQEIFIGFYLLFLFPLVYSILHLFNEFGHSRWVDNCCFVDYLKRNWLNPKYPHLFYNYMLESEDFFGFTHDLSAEEELIIKKQLVAYKWNFRKTVSVNTHNNLLEDRVSFMGWTYRIATRYRCLNGVRWMHTNKNTVIQPLNNAMSLFARNSAI